MDFKTWIKLFEVFNKGVWLPGEEWAPTGYSCPRHTTWVVPKLENKWTMLN